jgi:Glycosyl hydrolases family 39
MTVRGRNPTETRMQMLYGVNQADQCRDFAVGPARELIGQRLREVDTRLIRLFLFDKGAPDPVTEWPVFASYVRAVLNVGATPMITFAKLSRPLDDPRAVRWFANQCADVVWSCVEQWGGEAVRDWFWCVWNEPNNAWISGPVTFEQYRRVYEEVAEGVLRWLAPYLGGRKARIGGPAVEGFQPFWWDWAWRFVHEIDNRLIGFLDWHRYADWRNYGENGAPRDEAAYRGLILSVAPDYELRARAVAELVRGRDILNICGELNTHSHYTEPVRAHFNQSVFGATFYTAALLRLMRGGAFAEMFWTGTEDRGGYGMMNKHGDPWPVFHAKRLCARYVRHGDWISFPAGGNGQAPVDVVIARGEDGRRSALVVHLTGGAAKYAASDLTGGDADYQTLLKIDEGTGNRVAQAAFDGTVPFEGHGVAVVTTAAPVADKP